VQWEAGRPKRLGQTLGVTGTQPVALFLLWRSYYTDWGNLKVTETFSSICRVRPGCEGITRSDTSTTRTKYLYGIKIGRDDAFDSGAEQLTAAYDVDFDIGAPAPRYPDVEFP
jgi:hypothetical protein